MVEFAYNNAKNPNTDHISFELNCSYHLQTFYEKDTNPRFQSKLADKQVTKLKELMTIYKENL